MAESQERASESETPIQFAKSKPTSPIAAAAENRTVLRRYSVALLSFAFSLFLRLSLSSVVGLNIPYIPFIPAIMVSGWYGGLGPGLLTTVCSAIAAVYFFIEPVNSLRITNQGDLVGLLLFLAVGSLISWLNEMLRRASHQAQSELLARTRSEEALQKEQEKLRDSNRRTENILESITDEFSAVDREWRFTYINERALNTIRKVKGEELMREDLVGKNVWKLFPELVSSVFYHKHHEAVREQKTVHFEGYSPLTNRWVEVHAYPSEEGLSIYSRDITERKRMEQTLQENQQRLSVALESSPVAFTILRAARDARSYIIDFEWLYLNPVASRILGRAPEDLIGRRVREVLPDGWEPPGLFECFVQVVNTGEPQEIEVASRRNGIDGWFHNIAAKLGDGVAVWFTDVTERKRAEAALRESNRRIESILESITDEFTAVDREWRFIYINERALNSMRKAKRKELMREDLVGKTLWKLFPEYVGSVHYHKFHEAMREQKTIHFEGYSLMTNRWVEVHAYPSEVGLSIYSRDITERKRADEQLAYHAHLLENVHDAVIATDERFVLTAWNKGAEQMYGWRADEVLGRNVLEVVPWDLSGEERAKARKALAETGRGRVEVTMYRKDGTPVYVEGRSIALRGEQGQITGYLRINRDITERKRAEEERAQLLRRLMAAQEDERRRIAREMHDQFGQEVSALTLKLAVLKGAHGGQSELGEQLVALEAIARQLDEDLDFLIWEMRPTALDDLGLVVALSNYVENWSKHFGVHADLHATGMDKHRLTSEVETVLYRVTQEALNNIAKHARATNVDILLERRSDHVSLIIEDDGVGFDTEKAFGTEHRGLGLIGMRERAALVDGKLEIESHPGNGATIVVRIRAPVVSKRGDQYEKIEHSLSGRS